MRFWTAYAFIALSFANKSWGASAEGGHHASLTDLIAPIFNVAVLLGVLIWKIKGPLKKYFDSKASEIENTVERANLKSKEAQHLLEDQSKKMASLDNEVKALHQQSETDVLLYEKKLAKEIEEKILKLKTDANLKIQAEKKQMMDQLNAELLDQVISKTKSTIKSNKDFQGKVSTKLLQGLQ